MVIPGLCGISFFGPRLDQNGNSARGVTAATMLTRRVHLNMLSFVDSKAEDSMFEPRVKADTKEREVN